MKKIIQLLLLSVVLASAHKCLAGDYSQNRPRRMAAQNADAIRQAQQQDFQRVTVPISRHLNDEENVNDEEKQAAQILAEMKNNQNKENK